MNMKHKTKDITLCDQRGMTMIELVAALAVLSIGVMGIVKMHVEDMRQTRALQEDYLATRLMENEWAYLQTNPPQGTQESEKFLHTFDESLLREMKTTLHSKQVVNSQGLLEVQLRVEWFSTLGRFKHQEATMLLPKRSMGVTPMPHGQDVRAPLIPATGDQHD